MTITTRKIIKVGATSRFLGPTDEGSGSLIVASEITPRRDNEIDLHTWRCKQIYFDICHGKITRE